MNQTGPFSSPNFFSHGGLWQKKRKVFLQADNFFHVDIDLWVACPKLN